MKQVYTGNIEANFVGLNDGEFSLIEYLDFEGERQTIVAAGFWPLRSIVKIEITEKPRA